MTLMLVVAAVAGSRSYRDCVLVVVVGLVRQVVVCTRMVVVLRLQVAAELYFQVA